MILSEYSSLIRMLNINVTDAEVKAMFELFDEDRSGKITFGEFIHAMPAIKT